MTVDQIPSPGTVSFTRWTPFRLRERISDDFDTPPQFGLLGIYLFASWESAEPPPSESQPRHLDKRVIYVGMSNHILQRLSSSHHVVRAYRKDFKDTGLKQLYVASWESPWSNERDSQLDGHRARILALEAHLVAEYSSVFGQRPRYNRN